MAVTRRIIDILNLPTGHLGHIYNARGKDALTYSSDSVRIHTVPLDYRGRDKVRTHIKYAEFVDILGNVTDEFRGTTNDFDLWFLGKAGRGEQFFIIGFRRCGSEMEMFRVTGYDAWIGAADGPFSSAQEFVQDGDMTWRPAS